MVKKSDAGGSKIISNVNLDNSCGVTSVVLGIISVVSSLAVPIGSLAGVVLGITSLIFAFKQRGVSPNRWSTAGIVLSIIGILINLFIFILLVGIIIQIVDQLNSLQQSGLIPLV